MKASITLSEADREALQYYAESRGCQTIGALLRVALAEYVRRHKPSQRADWAIWVRDRFDA